MSLIADQHRSQFERLPPHSKEAEMCVLGSLMLMGDNMAALNSVKTKVRSDEFFHADHQIIYDQIMWMVDKGKPLDAVILREELSRRGLLDEIGGTVYLAEVLGTMPSYFNADHYANIVREKALRRKAISLANDILREAYAPNESSGTEILRRNGDRLLEAASTGCADQFTRIHVAADKFLADRQDNNSLYIRTKMHEFDSKVGGIPVQKFTLVGGRPGMGKSLWCKQLAFNVAEEDIGVGIVTIEEDQSKIASNALSNYSEIRNSTIAYGNLDNAQWHKLRQTAGVLENLPIWINDQPSMLSEVADAVTTAAVKHKCKLVIVDYLQLIEPDDAKENENRDITIISRTLKRLAKRLGIALVAACQLNRGRDDGASTARPTLKSLRGSGSLEQDGDLIVLLHRPEYYMDEREIDEKPEVRNYLECVVAKYKSNNGGIIPMRFNGDHQRITDWSLCEDPF